MKLLLPALASALLMLGDCAAQDASDTIRICDASGCAYRSRSYVAPQTAPAPAPQLMGDTDKFRGEDTNMLRQEADAGSAVAAYKLGQVYAYGLDRTGADWARAGQYYAIAANAGHPWAEFRLAELYRTGQGVPKSALRFMQLTYAAANQGLPAAAYNLGLVYVTGTGVPADPAEAVRWFSQAAAAGNPDAAYNLALMQMRGQGVTVDLYDGLQMMRKAGAEGSLDAQDALGHIYASGLDTMKPDPQEARTWFGMAAARGSADAQAALKQMEAAAASEDARPEKRDGATRSDEASAGSDAGATMLATTALAFIAGAAMESWSEPEIVEYDLF